MRSLKMSYIFLIGSILLSHISYGASKNNCSDLSKRVQEVKRLQGILTQKGVKGELRLTLNKLLDDGIEIDDTFIQKIHTNASLKARGFNGAKSLNEHFEKHGQEFGNITKKEYAKRAQKLAESRHESLLTVKTNNGTFKYDPNSNELLIVSKEQITTYYRPDLKVINDSFVKRGFEPFNSVLEWIVKSKSQDHHY